MRYSDFIQQEKEFTRSANVQFDIANDRKLARFIPNETTVKLFKDYFISISMQNGNHAKQLHGSYGTGKSHFLTVLSNVLAHQNTSGVAFDMFVNRIAKYDEELAEDIKTFIQKSNPFLIVPITFDFKDFNRCIIFSIQKVLDEKKVKIKFKNFYVKALEVVELWLKEEESKQKLLKFCEEKKIQIETFIGELKRYNSQYEKLFKEVFSLLSYGVEFIPEQTNLISTLDEIRKAVADCYQGIVFIFDEFGRYFEENSRSLRISEVQTLAEYCNNTKFGNHIIFVTHKELSQYTSEMSESAANEWRKVEGRFEATSINDKRDQCLSLISNILIKRDDIWTEFVRRYQKEFDALKGQVADFNGFLIADVEHDPVEISYPLHPIALYVLDRLSKKIAQNERTFFTYLASETENSIHEFLINKDTETDGFCFVGLDMLFDYFEANLKAVRSDSSYQIYKAYQRALNKLTADNAVETSIIKAIAVIDIVDEFQVLSPSKKKISHLIDFDSNAVEKALDNLVVQKILNYSRVYERYEFFDASSLDIEDRVKKNFEVILDEAVIDILGKEFSGFALWPYVYNNTYKIQRAILPYYIDLNAAKKDSLIKKLPEYYDGLLCLALNGNGDAEDIIKRLSLEVPRSIFIANSSSKSLFNEAKKYLAILLLDSVSDELAKEDILAKKEIEYYKREQHQILSNKINELLNVFDDCNKVFVNGMLRTDIVTFDGLTTVADEIMQEFYPSTLIVNNELLNKNSTTGAMNTAKKKAIEAMLFTDATNNEVYAGLQLMSPEYNCIRSVLTRNSIIHDPSINNLSALIVRNANLVKNEMDKYIKRISSDSVEFSVFFNIMKKPPFGLRTGYLSILVANMLKPHLNNLTIMFNGVEQEITPQLVDDMVQRPDLYNGS